MASPTTAGRPTTSDPHEGHGGGQGPPDASWGHDRVESPAHPPGTHQGPPGPPRRSTTMTRRQTILKLVAPGGAAEEHYTCAITTPGLYRIVVRPHGAGPRI